MLIFQQEHVAPILCGTKTQTRRLGKKRWIIGATHRLMRTMFGKPFGVVRIVDVRREYLTRITDADVKAEGYEDREAYIEAFRRINRIDSATSLRGLDVWAVEFELVRAYEGIRVEIHHPPEPEGSRRRLAD